VPAVPADHERRRPSRIFPKTSRGASKPQ
jgi:hypothetical protein